MFKSRNMARTVPRLMEIKTSQQTSFFYEEKQLMASSGYIECEEHKLYIAYFIVP